MSPHGVLETALYVDDIDAAERFYRDVLGFTLFSREDDHHVFFRCGQGMLLLFNAARTVNQDHLVNGSRIPAHGCRGAGHIAFALDESEVDAWRAKLKAAGVAIESEVNWPQGGHSIYFRDPAGNSLELATPAVWTKTVTK